jgi:hypothetical protein
LWNKDNQLLSDMELIRMQAFFSFFLSQNQPSLNCWQGNIGVWNCHAPCGHRKSTIFTSIVYDLKIGVEDTFNKAPCAFTFKASTSSTYSNIYSSRISGKLMALPHGRYESNIRGAVLAPRRKSSYHWAAPGRAGFHAQNITSYFLIKAAWRHLLVMASYINSW